VMLFCFPFVLSWGIELNMDLAEGIVVGGAAYLVGHVLQALARPVVPHGIKGHKWSFILLHLNGNKPERHWAPSVREQLVAAISSSFGINVEQAEDLDRTRDQALRMCRAELTRSGLGSLSEQFEGMYALNRGLSAGCAAASVYLFGWATGLLGNAYVAGAIELKHLVPVLGLVLLTGLAVLLLVHDLNHRNAALDYLPDRTTYKYKGGPGRSIAIVMLIGALLLGALCGAVSPQGTSTIGYITLLGSAFSLVICIVGYRLYQRFARVFVYTVYTNFLLLQMDKKDQRTSS